MPHLLSAVGRLLALLFGRGYGSLKANIGLGVLSLALAVSLWAFVTEEENPGRTDLLADAIPVETVNLPQGLAVASISDTMVRVRVSAPKDVWDKLTVQDFRAIADLSTARAQENTVTVRFESKRRQADVVSADPSQITVTLEPLTTKVVPVTLKLIGTPPVGYSAAPGKTAPNQVEVTGAESLVALVEEADADVNVQGVRVPLDQSVTLIARDGRGGDIDGVTMNPPTVNAVVPIVQQEITQVYAVTAAVRGAPSDGFNVTSVSVQPPLVVVTGPIEQLQSLTAVTTDEVDIDGATSDVVRAANLQLPAGLTVVGSHSVTVHVAVSPAAGQITLGVTPTVQGLGPGLNASVAAPLVEVRVTGEIPVLRALSPSSVSAVVDVSGLPAGQHVLPVQATAPPGVQVAGVEPATVIVTLSAP